VSGPIGNYKAVAVWNVAEASRSAPVHVSVFVIHQCLWTIAQANPMELFRAILSFVQYGSRAAIAAAAAAAAVTITANSGRVAAVTVAVAVVAVAAAAAVAAMINGMKGGGTIKSCRLNEMLQTECFVILFLFKVFFFQESIFNSY